MSYFGFRDIDEHPCGSEEADPTEQPADIGRYVVEEIRNTEGDDEGANDTTADVRERDL